MDKILPMDVVLEQYRFALQLLIGAAGILMSVIGGLLIYSLNRLNRTIDSFGGRLTDVELSVAKMKGFQEGIKLTEGTTSYVQHK